MDLCAGVNDTDPAAPIPTKAGASPVTSPPTSPLPAFPPGQRSSATAPISTATRPATLVGAAGKPAPERGDHFGASAAGQGDGAFTADHPHDEADEAEWGKGRGEERNLEDWDGESSALFQATLAGGFQAQAIADLGTDVSVISSGLLGKFRSTYKRHVKVEKVDQVPFQPAFTSTSLICRYVATLDVSLRVRHAHHLTLVGVPFYVVPGSACPRELLLGRELLERLCVNARDQLALLLDRRVQRTYVSVRRFNTNSNETQGPEEVPSYWDLEAEVADSSSEDEGAKGELGPDDPDEVARALQAMLEKARSEGLSEAGVHRLRGILEKHSGVFRIRYGQCAAARFPPMRVILQSDARPFIAKPRRYSEEQREFLKRFVTRLERYGFVRRVESPIWSHAPLLVRKKGKARWRMTIDLRPVNKFTLQTPSYMPSLESELSDFRQARCYGSFDACQGYWQMPLDRQTGSAHAFTVPVGSKLCTHENAAGSEKLRRQLPGGDGEHDTRSQGQSMDR